MWRFDRAERLRTEDGQSVWSARAHHDWQREGSPVGYYAPGAEPMTAGGRTLILAHKNVFNADVSPKRLEDDYLFRIPTR